MIAASLRKILLFFVFPTIILFLFIFSQKQQTALPVISQLKDFELIDSTNRSFNSSQLKGKVWVAQFFFTTCGGICPMITKKMGDLYRSYKLDKRVEFVSITVNPDNDNPEVLTRYLKQHDADPQQWHFLTGPRTAIQDLSAQNFKVGSVEEPVFHSGHFILIDQHGWIRGYYDGTDEEGTKRLFKDIAVLLKEKSK